jgi:hypothetical protein
LVSEALFRRFLFLGECEALSFFPASCAFLSVVSTFAVSHKSSTVAFLSRRGKLVALGDCHCYRILLHQAGGCVFRPVAGPTLAPTSGNGIAPTAIRTGSSTKTVFDALLVPKH